MTQYPECRGLTKQERNRIYNRRYAERKRAIKRGERVEPVRRGMRHGTKMPPEVLEAQRIAREAKRPPDWEKQRRLAHNVSAKASRDKVRKAEPRMTGAVLGEYARKHFRYDPVSGQLFKKESGQRAGNLRSRDGYLQLRCRSRLYFVHQLVWAMHGNEVPTGLVLDHINRNRADNRIENLRVATHGKNMQNCGVRSHNSAGLKGVRSPKGFGGWAAYIKVDGKPKYLGTFQSKEDAARAYDAAVVELRGEFAVTNASLGLLPDSGAAPC